MVLKKILLVVLAILVALPLLTYGVYLLDRRERLQALEEGSQLAETPLGPIEYQIIGSDGPVVMFLHGTPGGYDFTWPLEGYRVLLPSRPGYLRTPLSVGRSPSEQAGAYIALLDTLGIERVAVVGLSGGGPSALHFAVEYPERTAALIDFEMLVLPIEVPDEFPIYLRSDFIFWAFVKVFGAMVGMESFLEVTVPDPANRAMILGSEAKLELLDEFIWQQWPPVTGRTAGIRNDLAEFRVLELPLDRVRVPTLIIHGTADAALPVEQSKKLASIIPDARLELIEGADHFMMISHADQIQEMMRDFLAGVDF